MQPLPPELFSPVILLHTVAALTAIPIGALVFIRPKGNQVHRKLGRAWAALMLAVILTSFFIRGDGQFSWIHLLSIGSLIALAWGVVLARKHNIAGHRRTMFSLYVGGLMVAGLFTLLPSRLLGSLLWHSLGITS